MVITYQQCNYFIRSIRMLGKQVLIQNIIAVVSHCHIVILFLCHNLDVDKNTVLRPHFY